MTFSNHEDPDHYPEQLPPEPGWVNSIVTTVTAAAFIVAIVWIGGILA